MINNNAPKVSVIMSVYNGEKYLKEAIDSILNQTFKDFEFIIINDFSNDKTEEIIKSYDDNRIIYLKNEENLGLTKSLNKGIRISRGKYIARMDADDISLPNRFEKQINFMENNLDIGILGGWIELFSSTKSNINKYMETVDYLSLLKESKLSHPTIFIRKSIIDKFNLYYDENFRTAQDYELFSRAIKYTKIQNLQEIVLRYRWHDDNISKKLNKNQTDNTFKIKANMFKFLLNNINITKENLNHYENIITQFNKINNIKTINLFYFIPFAKILYKNNVINKIKIFEIIILNFKYNKRFINIKLYNFLNIFTCEVKENKTKVYFLFKPFCIFKSINK